MKSSLHILPMGKLSGAEKLALLICKNSKNFKPIVLCGSNELKKIFNDNNIKAHSIDFSIKKLLSVINDINYLVKENNIVIIHAHDNLASISSLLAKKIFKLDVKVVSHIHNCYPFLESKCFRKNIDSYARKKYDFNIACGNLVYDFYYKNSKMIDEKKFVILSNAMDLHEINNFKIDEYEIKKKYDIDENYYVFGFIGRLDEQKGLIPFIKELALSVDKFKKCKFLIVGNGSQEDEIKYLIKKMNLEKYFIFTGFKKDVYEIYPLIDTFFLPSLYEGLPMVLLEAIAFNKNIVTMDVGSISEIIKDKYSGYLIESGNYKKFIEALEECYISDYKINRKYKENAYKIVEKKYDIKNYVDKLEKIYLKILD